MIRTLLIACLVFFITGNVRLSAQCIDSTHIQNGAYCDPAWVPVCACDGHTYRSDCVARNKGFTSWYYGICDAIDFDFNPNPAADIINIDAMMKNAEDMDVQLIDRFGQIFYSTTFPASPGVLEQVFQIDVQGFPTGVYFLKIFCKDGMKVKKVVVPELQ